MSGKSLAYRAWEQQFTAELPPCPVCGEKPRETLRQAEFPTHPHPRWTLSCTAWIHGTRHLMLVSNVDRAKARQAWMKLATSPASPATQPRSA